MAARILALILKFPRCDIGARRISILRDAESSRRKCDAYCWYRRLSVLLLKTNKIILWRLVEYIFDTI